MEQGDAVEPEPWAAAKGQEDARMGMGLMVLRDLLHVPRTLWTLWRGTGQQDSAVPRHCEHTGSASSLSKSPGSLWQHQHPSGSLPFGVALAPSWPGESHRPGAGEDGSDAQFHQIMALQLPWPQSCS